MEFNQFLLSLVKLDSATEASKGLGELLREKVKLEKGLANLERKIELSRIHANHQSHYDNGIARYIIEKKNEICELDKQIEAVAEGI